MAAFLLAPVIGLVLLGVVFGIVERFWPAIPGQRRRRRGWRTDIAWWFVQPFVANPLTAGMVIVMAVVIALLAGSGPGSDNIRAWLDRETLVNRQPPALQAIEALVLLELVAYWSHRAFHRLGMLWKFHAIHHSSEELDWLSSVRVHPLNEAGQRMAQAVPVILLGFDLSYLAIFVPALTFYAIMLHSNVPWGFGPLRYVVASPCYHRWHHTSEQEGLDKNFAGLFPWLDVLFGTFYMPRDRQPDQFGVRGEVVPEGFWGQVLYPWRRAPAAPPPVHSGASQRAG